MTKTALDVFLERSEEGKRMTYKELQAAFVQALQERADNKDMLNEYKAAFHQILIVFERLANAFKDKDEDTINKIFDGLIERGILVKQINKVH